MTKQQKIEAILSYAFEGTRVTAENQRNTRAQFTALTDAEVEREYARMLRRQERLNKGA